MPVPESAQTLERPILRESVYGKLRDWIVQGVLEPGEQLRDQELAERLGVSRTPVREALRRLEDEGLVETAKNRWTRVKPVELSEAEQIYPIRSVLDSLALELAFPHLSKDDLKSMTEANKRLEQALKASNIPAVVEADMAFHDAYLLRCGNPELIEMLMGLKLKHYRLELTYFGNPKLGLVSVGEHAEVIKSIRENNPKMALKHLRRNFVNALARLRDHRAGAVERKYP